MSAEKQKNLETVDRNLPIAMANDHEQRLYENGGRSGDFYDFGWDEIEIYASEQNSSEVIAIHHKTLADTPLESRDPSVENSDSRNYSDCRLATDAKTTPLWPIYKFMGIEVNSATDEQGNEVIHATVPSTEMVKEAFAKIRFFTGFATAIEEFPGGEFGYDVWANALADESMLISSDPVFREHDILTHAAAQALVTESMSSRIKSHIQRLQINPDESAKYIQRLDLHLSVLTFMRDLGPALEGNTESKRNLCRRLSHVLQLAPESDEMQYEIDGLLERAKQLQHIDSQLISN